MANLTEAQATVAVLLTRDLVAGTDTVRIEAQSVAADGTPLRRFIQTDLWPQLSATRKAQVAAILDDAIGYAKGRLEIP